VSVVLAVWCVVLKGFAALILFTCMGFCGVNHVLYSVYVDDDVLWGARL